MLHVLDAYPGYWCDMIRLVNAMLAAALLAACSSGSSASPAPTATVGVTLPAGAWPTVPATTTDHEPGPADVSTTEPGKPFAARPNFHYFRGCGRPCWLPLYPMPRLVPGTAVTKGWPIEPGDGREGDQVLVLCQVINTEGTVANGGAVQDDRQVSSNIWNLVLIPQSMVDAGDARIKFAAGLQPAPNNSGYLAYAADLWLGNTGDHNLPCTL